MKAAALNGTLTSNTMVEQSLLLDVVRSDLAPAS
jgi:hypothetical protein